MWTGPRAAWRLLLPLLLAAGLPACGGDKDPGQPSPGVPFDAAIREAQAVEAREFPKPAGRTLRQIANTLPAVNVGLATSVYTPGRNRIAFGVIDENQTFVYGKTAVYLARSPSSKARGPFPAPADPLVVDPPFRSRGAAEVTDRIAAIYAAQVDLPRTGRWSVLTVTKAQGRLYGAATGITVEKSSPIPAVGQQAPAVQTDTRTSAGGDIEQIDTRTPPDDMHDRSLEELLGRKPVALLFATPALCKSRVCGPVVDIAAQLQKTYGGSVEFIHQEVYVNNDPHRGLRRPLRAFKLRTEPWLFVIGEDGRVAARLEGSFGRAAFERAIRTAL